MVRLKKLLNWALLRPINQPQLQIAINSQLLKVQLKFLQEISKQTLKTQLKVLDPSNPKLPLKLLHLHRQPQHQH